MRILLATFSLWICLTLSLDSSAQSRGWRGIVPLHSTRADVERIMGAPTERSNQHTDFYRTPKETVLITYAQGLTCGIGEKYSQWRVPRGVVESILVTPMQRLRISDLGIDESKYDKRQGGHRREDVYYINEEMGESVRVFMGEVQNMSYFPGTLDKALRCPGLPTRSNVKCEGLAPPRFASYRNDSHERENALLDNFSIALTDEPKRTGYIIAYAGQRARVGEAKARAQRAKEYLVKMRNLQSRRLNVIDGGYREEAEVELFVVPDGKCPPTAAPSVDPRDVKVVNAAQPRAYRGG